MNRISRPRHAVDATVYRAESRMPAGRALPLVAVLVVATLLATSASAVDWQPVSEDEAQLMFAHDHLELNVIRRDRNVMNFDRA